MIRMGDRVDVLVDGKREPCVVLTIKTMESLVDHARFAGRKARRVVIECAVLDDIWNREIEDFHRTDPDPYDEEVDP